MRHAYNLIPYLQPLIPPGDPNEVDLLPVDSSTIVAGPSAGMPPYPYPGEPYPGELAMSPSSSSHAYPIAQVQPLPPGYGGSPLRVGIVHGYETVGTDSATFRDSQRADNGQMFSVGNGSSHLSRQEAPHFEAVPHGHLPPPSVPSTFPGSSTSVRTDFHPDHHVHSQPISGNPNDKSSTSSKDRSKKKPRQQFSACGACRQRRVRCDLKDKQEEWDAVHGIVSETMSEGGNEGIYGARMIGLRAQFDGPARREAVTCTNCRGRRMVCVDEFAAFKAAKHNRRAKRPGEPSSLAHPDEEVGSEGGEVGPGEQTLSIGPHRLDNGGSRFSMSGASRHPYDHRGSMQSHLERHPYEPRGSVHSHGGTGPRGSVTASAHGSDGVATPVGPWEGDGNRYDGMPSERQEAYAIQAVPATHVDALLGTEPENLSHHVCGIPPSGKHGPNLEPTVMSGLVHMLPPLMRPAPHAFDPPSEQSWSPSNISSLVPASDRTVADHREEPERYLHPPAATSGLPSSAVVSLSSEPQDLSMSPAGGDWIDIPELSASFFQSAFFRRFHIQRPIIDPVDLTKRYLSHSPPAARNMGLTGAILCHVFFAWACSYGVDENGELDEPERSWPGGLLPADERYVWMAKQEREDHRLRRKNRTDRVVKQIMREIDDAAVMRRHSWDGVRCLLLILPLTEFTSTPTERLAIYECAVAQVFALCSLSALNYEGLPLNLGGEGDIIRIRLYWYTFVHEGITTGLKGGRLVLEGEDLESFQGTLPNGWALVNRSTVHQTFVKFATAPIRLALACRTIHKALTGARARRQERVNRRAMEDAWEALERCWEEFESIREDPPPPHLKREDVLRFADGWKIFMFEAHNVIRESLEHRVTHLMPKPEGAFLRDLSIANDAQDSRQTVQQEIYKLHQIAKAKCEQLTKQIVMIVRAHVHTTFFEWDASLVRDGTFYAAMSLAKEGGSQEDIAMCLQALNEMRWAYAKTADRSKKLRDTWLRRNGPDTPRTFSGTSSEPHRGSVSSALSISPDYLPSTESLLQFQSISGLGANIGGWFPEGMMGDAGSVNPSSDGDVLGNMDEYDGEGNVLGSFGTGMARSSGQTRDSQAFDPGMAHHGDLGPGQPFIAGHFPPQRSVMGQWLAQSTSLDIGPSSNGGSRIPAWQTSVHPVGGAVVRNAGFVTPG